MFVEHAAMFVPNFGMPPPWAGMHKRTRRFLDLWINIWERASLEIVGVREERLSWISDGEDNMSGAAIIAPDVLLLRTHNDGNW